MLVEARLALRIAELEVEKARLEVEIEEYVLRVKHLESQFPVVEGESQDVEG